STSVEPRKHHVYTGLTNSIGILLETPNASRLVRGETVEEIPDEERYYHQIRGGVLAMTAILRAAADQKDAIRAVTSGSRARAIAAGMQGGDPVVLDYELQSRGVEPVWMPDSTAAAGYSLEDVPVFLNWVSTRTTTRPVGYLLPPAMAAIVPLLMDHDIAVYRFSGSASIDAEVYYATSVRRDSYFQGHYLQSVDVEKREETVEAVEGWFWVPTAQSRSNLISYLMEPETDDNLITWGWTDHILQVTPESLDEVMADMLGDRDPASLTAEQREAIQDRAQQIMDRTQQVPMMRVLDHPDLPVIRVAPYYGPLRTRFYRR
ncbi:MAG: hypothetical protein KJO11_13970, partial [Gemmatimonadetes bacterium]|nr:hypothetical protein [Gemmatimonadota bacterium]